MMVGLKEAARGRKLLTETCPKTKTLIFPIFNDIFEHSLSRLVSSKTADLILISDEFS